MRSKLTQIRWILVAGPILRNENIVILKLDRGIAPCRIFRKKKYWSINLFKGEVPWPNPIFSGAFPDNFPGSPSPSQGNARFFLAAMKKGLHSGIPSSSGTSESSGSGTEKEERPGTRGGAGMSTFRPKKVVSFKQGRILKGRGSNHERENRPSMRPLRNLDDLGRALSRKDPLLRLSRR